MGTILKPDVHITQNVDDPTQQVVTFEPPVASWSFHKDRTLDELWAELHQATSALLHDYPDRKFDEDLQQKTRARILTVVIYWKSQEWVTFESPPAVATT